MVNETLKTKENIFYGYAEYKGLLLSDTKPIKQQFMNKIKI